MTPYCTYEISITLSPVIHLYTLKKTIYNLWLPSRQNIIVQYLHGYFFNAKIWKTCPTTVGTCHRPLTNMQYVRETGVIFIINHQLHRMTCTNDSSKPMKQKRCCINIYLTILSTGINGPPPEKKKEAKWKMLAYRTLFYFFQYLWESETRHLRFFMSQKRKRKK